MFSMKVIPENFHITLGFDVVDEETEYNEKEHYTVFSETIFVENTIGEDYCYENDTKVQVSLFITDLERKYQTLISSNSHLENITDYNDNRINISSSTILGVYPMLEFGLSEEDENNKYINVRKFNHTEFTILINDQKDNIVVLFLMSV